MQMKDPIDNLPATEETIYSKLIDLIRLLRLSNRRLVLAESCTGGLVSAWFASIPGVSEVFCGSMVVYRNDSKTQWLGLDPQMLADPAVGPVSPQASECLVKQILEKTPEADIALGITGHLGPNAPEHLDRHVFLACLLRNRRVLSKAIVLAELPVATDPKTAWLTRRMLQAHAVEQLVDFALELLQKNH